MLKHDERRWRLDVRQHRLELIHARTLIDGIELSACLMNSAGRLVHHNQAAGRLLGPPAETSDEVPSPGWIQLLAWAISSPRPTPKRFRVLRRARESIEIEASAVPLGAADDRSGVLILFWEPSSFLATNPHLDGAAQVGSA